MVAFLAATVATLSGLLLWVVLPAGTHRSLQLWGLTRHTWGTVHAVASSVLIVLVLTHVAMHWRWVVSLFPWRDHDKPLDVTVRRAAVAVGGGGIAFVVAFLAVAWMGRAPLDAATAAEVCPEPSAAVSASSAPTEDGPAILARACVRCHGPDRQAAGFRADQAAMVVGSAWRRPLVVAGRPDESELMRIVSGARGELPAAHRLAEVDVLALRQWIERGAPW